jgi:hypothetical protein
LVISGDDDNDQAEDEDMDELEQRVESYWKCAERKWRA